MAHTIVMKGKESCRLVRAVCLYLKHIMNDNVKPVDQ